MSSPYLLDTSAWNRSNATEEVSLHWTHQAAMGRVGICPPVRLELLYSARSPDDYAAFSDDLAGLPSFPLSRKAVDRAASVQSALSRRSQHRGPNPIDLYIAAIAEVHGLAIVHYDRHFDAIVEITGQAAEWIAPRGTLD